MLIHMVCFKYKAEVAEAVRSEHRERLRDLAGIDGIIDLRVGADLVRSPRSYDTGLAVKFRDRAALDAYQKNPTHVPVVQLGTALCDSIVAVDFESDK